jgi:YVTN family beta-propeller protein
VVLTGAVMAYAATMTTAGAPSAQASPSQEPVGVGPLGITFNLTDENGGWFDSGLNLFGSSSLAIAEMPRVGTDVGVPSIGGPLLESDITGLTDPLTGSLLDGDLLGGGLLGDDLTGGLLGGESNPLSGVLSDDAGVNSLVAGLNLDDTLATVEGLAQTNSDAASLADEATGLIGELTDQLSSLPVDAPVDLDSLPVGVDLQGVLDELSEFAIEGPPISVTFNVDPSRSEAIRNPIGLIAPEGAEGFPYMDAHGAFFGEKTILLTEPGLYAFQESVAPYMLGAVVVDDPLTLGLDFGERLMVNGQEESVPSNADIIQRLVNAFFTITNPNNWQTYSETEAVSWNPLQPPAPILQYDEDGNQVLIPNLDAYYDQYFDYPRTFPAMNQRPAIPGVGEVWVDTEVEEYAGKTKTGAATRINAEDWTIDMKISGSEINMNNPHNMWTDANYQYLYQTEWWDDDVNAFDRETGELVNNTVVGPNPAHVMTMPGSDELVVGLNAGREIVTLSPGAGEVTGRFDVDPDNAASPHPHAHWTSYDGSTVVAPQTMTNEAVIMDMESGTVRHEPTGYFPIATSMTPDSSAAYLSDFLGMSITCISLAEDACGTSDGGVAHSETIDLWENYDPQTGPTGGVGWGGLTIQLPVSPDGEALLAANTLSQSVSVIDPATNEVVMNLPCNAGCHGINFGAKQGGGYYGYVSNKFSNVMQVIDYDPNGDGDISDAAVVGQLVLAPDVDTQMEDTLTNYAGFGGQGVLAIPLVYNGWSQEVPAGWREELTCEQLNPVTPSAC